MISEKKINNVSIRPLITNTNVDIKKIKGGNLIPSSYNVTFLCAKRKSGKTSTLAEILQKTSDKKTTFWIFCPTHRVDSSWKELIKILENKGNLVNLFDSIMDGKTNNLDIIMNDLSNPEEEECDDDKKLFVDKPLCKIKFDNEEEEKKKKIYKPKKVAPEHIFVFDDISHELKNPSIAALLKKSRHFKSAVYLSFQYPLDIRPECWKQAEYCLCFKSFSRDKLEHIHKHMDLTCEIEDFYNIYDYVFKDPSEKWNFLYIDVRDQLYRKNFNKKLDIE
jgi:hypothetical protein